MGKKELPQLIENKEALQLAAIQEVNDAITSKLSLFEILNVITKAAIVTFEAPSAWVMIEHEGVITTLSAKGRNSHILDDFKINSDAGILRNVWNKGKIEIFLPGMLSQEPLLDSLLEKREALILIPFGGKEKKLGMLGCIVPQKLAVSMKFLVTLAGQAALSVEREKLSQSLVHKTSENTALLQRVNILNSKEIKKLEQEFLWSNNPAMREIYYLVEKVNQSPFTPVLLEGETGVGKELIASLIHYGTEERKRGAFLKLNCASLSETLLESELFGHERGAFTDAKETKKGLLELAHQGTIFLDEIGDMSPRIQARMLRVLEHMSFRRVGGTKEITVEFRLVAATNKDLEEEVLKNNFRQDLLHRLRVISIKIPPLRDRKEDILPLAKFFLEKFSTRLRKRITDVSHKTAELLFTYDYPGNVRELKNIIERGVIMENDSILHPQSLALPPLYYHSTIDLITTPSFPELSNNSEHLPERVSTLKEMEKEHIRHVLTYTNGNKVKASELLGISYPTLHKKVKDYNL